MSIYSKLLEAKKEIGKISKDSTNPFYKSKYFDINQLLEHVEPILQKHELLLLQPIEDDAVKSIIISVEDNTNVFSELQLTEQTDPQKRGSEITYYRRYTLQSLLGLQAEDDDANATVKAKHENKEDDRPWLSEKQFNDAKARIEKGESDLFKKLDETFRMKKDYRDQLKRLSRFI